MNHGIDYSKGFLKGDKIVKLLSSVHIEPIVIRNHHSFSTKALPRITLEEMNLLTHVEVATSSCQVLIKFMFSMIL